MMSSISQLSRGLLGEIYRDRDTIQLFSELEASIEIRDQMDDLAGLVNTSVSRYEPQSRWVKYREAYSPAIVQMILADNPIGSEQFVFDPMCGSGSTQLGAQDLGYSSFGTDVSPYAALLSEVKCASYSSNEQNEIRKFASEVASLRRGSGGRLSHADDYLSRYFPIGNLRQLVAMRRAINALPRNKVSKFLRVALLAIVEDSSNRKKDGNGLVSRASKVENPVVEFEKKVDEMLSDVVSRSSRLPRSITIEASALRASDSIRLASKSLKRQLGSIIFSPPYANSFDYYETYKLELIFGGFFDSQTIRVAKKQQIRNFRQGARNSSMYSNPYLDAVIREILDRIPEKEARSGVRDGRSRLLPFMLRGYFEDMLMVLRELFEASDYGTKTHIVVDQSAYLGVLVPTDLILGQIAKDVGFDFSGLTICRSARTSAQQTNKNDALSQVLRESIVSLSRR